MMLTTWMRYSAGKSRQKANPLTMTMRRPLTRMNQRMSHHPKVRASVNVWSGGVRQLRLKLRTRMTDEIIRRANADPPDYRPLSVIMNDCIPEGRWAMEAYLVRCRTRRP